MRRAPYVIGGTAAGLALVLSFHTSSPSLAVSAGAPGSTSGAATPTTSAAPPPRGSASRTGTSGTGTSSASSSGTSSSSTAPPTTAASTPSTSPPTTAAPSTTTTAPTTRSATGQQVFYRYGVLELKVTVSGNRIKSITTVEDQATDPRSAEINGQAIPMLHDQAMQAQSANIDGVSGATYTSQAYVQSLQAALDQLGHQG